MPALLACTVKACRPLRIRLPAVALAEVLQVELAQTRRPDSHCRGASNTHHLAPLQGIAF